MEVGEVALLKVRLRTPKFFIKQLYERRPATDVGKDGRDVFARKLRQCHASNISETESMESMESRQRIDNQRSSIIESQA